MGLCGNFTHCASILPLAAKHFLPISYRNLISDQDNFYEINLNIYQYLIEPVCWLMYKYYREKFHVNYFLEFKR